MMQPEKNNVDHEVEKCRRNQRVVCYNNKFTLLLPINLAGTFCPFYLVLHNTIFKGLNFVQVILMVVFYS